MYCASTPQTCDGVTSQSVTFVHNSNIAYMQSMRAQIVRGVPQMYAFTTQLLGCTATETEGILSTAGSMALRA